MPECVCGCKMPITNKSPSEFYASAYCYDRYHGLSKSDPSYMGWAAAAGMRAQREQEVWRSQREAREEPS